MNHEIRALDGRLLDVLRWVGPAWTPCSEEAERRRQRLRERAVERAYELGGLAYERRSDTWLESAHDSFACSAVDEDVVEVSSPVGHFWLRSLRGVAEEWREVLSVVAPGELAAWAPSTQGRFERAVVGIRGRLCAPGGINGAARWTFEASHFVYADGSSGEFLGMLPRGVTFRAGRSSRNVVGFWRDGLTAKR